MGLIARVLSFIREVRPSGAQVSYAKFQAGSEPTLRGEHFAPPGDDSHPLPGDYCYSSRQRATGRWAVLGYLDARNAPEAEPGERRFYSRNADGEIQAVVWLKADGAIELSNAEGSILLQSGGTVVINGVQIDPSGNITGPGDADFTGDLSGATVTETSGNVGLGTHTHGMPPDTPPPTPGS